MEQEDDSRTDIVIASNTQEMKGVASVERIGQEQNSFTF